MTNRELRTQNRTLGRTILIALVMLLAPALAPAADFTASTLGDYGNVTVMEVTGSFDARNSDGSENLAARKAVANEFFRTHKDEYDFLVIFSNFDYQMIEGEADAFYHGVRNDVYGIGQPQFNFTSQYGSKDRLQGTIDMGSLASHATDPLDPKFNQTLSTLSHEMMHRWGAYAKFKDSSGAENSSLLGRNGAHWSFLLDSGGSLMYGNKWRDNGNGTFTSLAPQSEQKYYSPLDLYLMGMLDRSQVPPMLLIENASIDPNRLPEAGVTISGQAKTVTIDDIIASTGMGERVPSSAASQKSFKTAFIFLARPGTFTGQEIYGIENIRNGAVTRFSVLTDGRSIMEVASTPKPDVAVNPGVLPPSTTPRSNADTNAGMNWLMTNQRTDGSWMDLAQTMERDTAEAVLTLKSFPAALTNVEAGLLWLGSSQSLNVDYLCRKIEAVAASGADVSALVTDLLGRQNSDGGWGSERTYASNAADTALALKALSLAGSGGQQAISRAVQYLRTGQKPLGGWTGNGESTIQATTAALSALNRYRGQFALDVDIAKGMNWLLSKRTGGGFGQGQEATVYDTALAVLVLRELDVETTITNPAVDFLRLRQDVNGSWNSSVFETALAVKAILKGNVDPDLVVRSSDIIFAPDRISSLPATVSIHVAVSNFGQTPVQQAKVALYDGVVSDASKIGETIVAVSSQATATFSTTISDGNEHTFIAVVTSLDSTKESNESNNRAGRTLPVQTTRDFEVLPGDVSVSQTNVPLYQEVTITAWIGNKGTAAGYSVPVKFSVTTPSGPIEIATITADIPANGRIKREVTWQANRFGVNMPVTVQVNPGNPDEYEPVRTNNSASTTLTVAEPVEPNVSVSYKDLVVTPATLLEGGSATISAIIRNDGGSAVSDVVVTFYSAVSVATGSTSLLPQDVLGAMTIPFLNSGQSTTAALSWSNLPGPGANGDRIIAVRADPPAGTREIRTDDNLAFTTVPVLSLPELAVSANAISIQPAFPNDRDRVSIVVTVQNSGDQEARGDARGIIVQAMEGATPISLEQTIPALAGHATATVGFAYGTTVSKGSHEITVIVDPENIILERNKQNNRATRVFGVQDGDLWVTERYFSPNGDGVKDATELFFRLPSTQTVTVAVRNKRGDTVRTFRGPELQNISAGSVRWDGLSSSEKIVDDGEYRLAVLGGNSAELGSVAVVVDNNRSSITEAVGTPYLLNNIVTCPLPDVWDWKWYSDDSGIVFALTDDWRNETGYTPGLYTIPPDGDAVVRLIPGEWTTAKYNGTDFDYSIVAYDISPNNDKIAFILDKYDRRHYRNIHSQLWTVDRDGSRLTLIVSRDLTKEYTPLLGLKWSPRGDALLVEMFNQYAHELWMIKTDGTPPLRIDSSDSWLNFNEVQWSPDGSRFIYPVESAANSSVIIRLYEPGSVARDVTSVPGYVASLSWLDNTKILLYDYSNLAVLDADDITRNVTIANGVMDTPVVAPNGSGFAFHVLEGGSRVLKIADASGAIRVIDRITPNEARCEAHVSGISWSPDGAAVAYKTNVVWEIPDYAIYQCVDPAFIVWERAAGEKRTLSGLSDDMNLTGWMTDGRTIVVTRETSTASYLAFVNASTGEVSATLAEGTSYGSSPREHYITYMRYADETTPCAGTSSTDIGAISSLLNLTADLRIVRDKSFVALKGIAADLNFEGYRLEYANTKEPTTWLPVVPPSDSPVMNGTFLTWVPPSEGVYLVRLTVWDRAGNTAVDRKRVSWGQASSISNLATSTKLISPANHDGMQDSVELHYHANEPVHLEFTVLDKDNSVVRTYLKDHIVPTDDLITWDGKNAQNSFVSDGEYVIKVFDLQFPVTVDNTVPAASVRFSPIALDDKTSAAMVSVYARAADDHIKSWVMEYSSGAEPETWTEYLRGEKPVGSSGGTDEGIVNLNVFGAIPLIGRQFRLTVDDLAGNRSHGVSGLLSEEMLTNSYDGRQLKLENGELRLTTPDFPELKPGSHTFGVISALRQEVASWMVQYSQDVQQTTDAQGRIQRTWRNWRDIAVENVPAAGIATLQWHAPVLDANKPAAVRVRAVDILGREFISAPLVVQNAFMIEPVCSADPSSNMFAVSNSVFSADIKQLHVQIAAVPTQLSIPVYKTTLFSLVPNGALTESLPAAGHPLPFGAFNIYIPADRFAAATDYSIRLVGVTDQGEQVSGATSVRRDDDPFSAGGGYELRLAVVPEEASCGQTSSGKTQIQLEVIDKIAGKALSPGRLPIGRATFLTTSYTMQEPAGPKQLGQFEFIPNGLGIVSVDASLLPEGRHPVEAVLNYRTHCGVSHTQYAVNDVYSDRELPTAAIQVPVQSSAVCAVEYPLDKGKKWYGVPVEASASDDNKVLRYKLWYAAGAEPADVSWQEAKTYDDKKGPIAIEGPRIPSPDIPLFERWYVSGITGTNFTLRLEAVDMSGNKTCTTTNFTVRDRVTVSGLTVDKRLFSPFVGEGKVNISFAVDDIATAGVTIHRLSVDGKSFEPGPVRTLTAPKSYPAGHGVEFWDGKNDNADIVEGKFVVVVTAGDPCGHSAVATSDVEVDATPPLASIIYPRPGDAFGTIVEVTGTASDTNFQSYKLETSLGSAPTSTAVWTEVKTGINPVSSNILGRWNNFGIIGEWTLRLTVVDAAGHSSTSSVLLNIGERTGLISDLSVKPGLISPNHDGKADGTVIGYGLTGAASVLIEISRAGTIVHSYTTNALSAGAYSYEWQGTTNAGLDVPDDTYTVRLTANHGSVIDTQSVTVLVDTTRPVVEITQPLDNAYLALRDVLVTGKITDQNIAEYAISYTGANGTTQIDKANQSRTAYLFGTLNDLAEGTYTIHVKATDLGENETIKNIPFTIDRTPPVVKLNTPKDGAYYGTVVTAASGTVISNPTSAAVSISGSIVEQNFATFSLRYGSGDNPTVWTDIVTGTTVTALPSPYAWNVGGIPDGLYTLSLLATDKAGLKGEARVKVTVDNTPPTVAVSSLQDGAYVKGAIEVTGTATDQNLERYTVDVSEGPCASAFRWTAIKKGSASVNGGSLASWQALPADGEYCIRVTAVDKIGSSAEAKVSVKVDTKPPAAPVLTGALENRTTASMSWQQVQDADLAGYNMYRNGQKVNDALVTALTYSNSGLTEGLYVYTVKAVDRAGWESPASNEVKLRVDLTGPDAKILSPASGSFVGDLVDIKGRAFSSEDFKNYRVSVGQGASPNAWNVVRTSSLPTSYGILAQLDALGLAENQVYSIKLDAEDLAGNVTTDRISITIDNTPPKTPELANPVVDGASVALQWSDSPDGDLAGYLLFVNDHLVNASQNIQQMDMRPYALPCPSYYHYELPDGAFTYRVAAVDRAGNMSALSTAVTATIDTRAPQIEIVEPATVLDPVTNQRKADIGGKTLVRAESPDLDIDKVTFYYSVAGSNTWYSIGESRQAPFEVAFTPAALNTTYNLKAEAVDKHYPQPNQGISPVITVTYKDLTPPPVPAGLAAKVTGSVVTLIWSAATDTDTVWYKLYRTSGNERVPAASAPLQKQTTTYQDVRQTDGAYSYDITAVDASGNESNPSAPVTARVYAPVIGPLAAWTTQRAVHVTGSNATSLASVRIEIASQNGLATAVTAADQVGLFSADITLSSGVNTIKATATDNAVNVSNVSNEVSIEFDALPDAPAGLAASVQGATVTLTWNSEGDVTGYLVYRKKGTEWIKLTPSATSALTWVDAGLRNGSYDYRVTAVDAKSEGPATGVTVTVAVNLLKAPEYLVATALPNGEAEITWQYPDGTATGYYLYRSTVEGGPYTRITSSLIAATAYHDRRLVNGARYFYVSTAVDPFGNESGYSNPGNVVAFDQFAPEKPVITAPTTSGAPIIVTMPTVTVAGTAEPGSTVGLYRNGIPTGTVKATEGTQAGTYSLDPNFSSPSLSPDGTQLAYTVNDLLWLMDLATASSTEIVPGGSQPVWSPDGKRIAYIYRDTITGADRVGVADIINGRAENAAPLTTDDPSAQENTPSWSSDGSKIVFTSFRSGVSGAWTKDLTGGIPILEVNGYNAQNPKFSPDGNSLAFGQNQNLKVLDRTTGNAKVVADSVDAWNFAWSPDGNKIAFLSWTSGADEIYVLDLGTNIKTRISASLEHPGWYPYWPSWLPDGRTVVYMNWDDTLGSNAIMSAEAGGQGTASPVVQGMLGFNYLAVISSGGIAYIDGTTLSVPGSSGQFAFGAVQLDPGENLFFVTATDGSGNVSAVSDVISVTGNLTQLSDLVVMTDDIVLYPAAPLAGQHAVMSIAVWNRGQSVSRETDVTAYVWNENGPLDLLMQGRVPALEPGAVHLVSAEWDSTGRSGANRLVAAVDTEQLVPESNEANNLAVLDFFVADHEGISLAASLDAVQYAGDATVNARVTVRNSGVPKDGSLSVRIEDQNGLEVAMLGEQSLSLSYASRQDMTFTWNTGSTYAGSYRLHAVVIDPAGSIAAEQATPFSILPDTNIGTTVTTDKASYGAHEPVGIAVTLNNLGRNRIIPLLTTRLTITNEAGAVLFSNEKGMTDMLPGASVSLSLVWNTGLSPAGSYTASLETLLDGSTLPVKSARFAVRGSAVVTGTLSVSPDPVPLGAAFRANYMLENSGNADTGPGAVRIMIIDPESQAALSIYENQAALVSGGSITGQADFAGLSNSLKTYTAVLHYISGNGASALASTAVAVKDVAAPTMNVLSPVTGAPYATTVSFLVAASDDASGVDRIEYRRDGGSWSLLPVSDPSRGRFGTTWDPTMADNGIHTVSFRAADRSGNQSEETVISYEVRINRAPTAPSLAAPADGSDVETLRPELMVNNASDPNGDSLSYFFEVYSDSDLKNKIIEGSIAGGTGMTGWNVPVDLVENAVYYWRSKAFDGLLSGPTMSVASFRVNAVQDPPTAPVPTSPADGTEVATFTPVLTVLNAVDPDSIDLTYNFQVSLNSACTQTVVSVTGVPSGQSVTSWQVTVQLAEDVTYYWCAQADDWKVTGEWSQRASFTVNTRNNEPTVPAVIAPENRSEVKTTSPDIILKNSTDPDSPVICYTIELDPKKTFDSPNLLRVTCLPQGQGATTWHVDGLLDNTDYFVRAKASDGAAESDWSGVITFFVNTANDRPEPPVPVNPPDGSGVNVLTPALTVKNATDIDRDALTYEFAVYEDAALSLPAAAVTGITEMPGTTSWTVAVDLKENRTYYWQARAFDGALPSEWTKPFSFTVNTGDDPPTAPTIVFPSEGSSVDTAMPALTVLNAKDPDSTGLTYEFEVYYGSALVWRVSGIAEGAGGSTSARLNIALNNNTGYSWRCRANDGQLDSAWTTMTNFTVHLPQTGITVDIEIEPETLDRKSKGNWVMAEIELPHGYNASDVDISSIRLEGTVPAVSRPFELKKRHHDHGCDSDHGEHDHGEIKVKFRRDDVIAILPAGDQVTVHITGAVAGVPFEGVDIIRVIH